MNNKLNNNFSLRKLLLTALVAGPLATLPAPLWALPDVASTNLTTSSGVTTQVVGTTLNVTAPDKAILTWQAFGSGASSIAAGDVINYFLPSATSSVLNSVSGNVASTISGSLISNGNVYVLNPAGIVISKTAQINTGGFYASTVAEPSGFFSINGSLSFAGSSTSNVIVEGTGTTSGTDVATIQAVGPGNNIYLAGNAVNVQGGKFFGNLYVRASGPTSYPLTGPNPVADAATTGVNVSFGSTGQVSINPVGATAQGGGLNITTNGGSVSLAGGVRATATATQVGGSLTAVTPVLGGSTYGTTPPAVSFSGGGGTGATATAVLTNGVVTGITITNAGTGYTSNPTVSLVAPTSLAVSPTLAATTPAMVSINTTGATNGNIRQIGEGLFSASQTGTVVTLNAGTGTSAGNITLDNTNFLTVGASGNNISIKEASGLALGATNAAGTLTVQIGTGNALSSAGTVTAGGKIDVQAQSVTITGSGNLTFSNIAASSTLTVSTNGDLTVEALSTSPARVLSLTSSGGKLEVTPAITSTTLTLAAPAGTINVTGLVTSGTTQDGVGGQGSITASGNITVGGITTRTNAGQNTNMTVTSSTGNLSLGAISAGSSLTATATAGSITTTTISSQTLTLTAANGSISTGKISAGGNAVSISGGSVTVGDVLIGNANLTLTASTGSLSTGAISAGTATVSLSAPSLSASVTNNGTLTKSATGNFNITAGGDINLGAGSNANTITVPTLVVTSTGGSIKQSAAITSTSRTTLTAAGDILLADTTFANDFGNVVLIGGANSTAGFNIRDANAIVLGAATNSIAPVTITSGAAGAAADITLGAVSTDSLRFGSTLTLNMANAANTGAVTTNANAVTVFGNVSVKTLNGNNVTLGSNIFGNAANYTFGQINADIGAGALQVYENQTLNLGTITAGSLDARSLSSNIVNTGKLSVTGNAIFAANSIFSPGTVSLTNSTNALSGNVIIGNATDFTLVNTGATTVVAGTSLVNGKSGNGITSVTVSGGGALVLKTDNAGVQTGGDFGVVSFETSGNVTITDPNTITLQNIKNTAGNVSVTTGRDSTGAVVTNGGGAIVLGSGISLASNGTTTLTSRGATAAITDSAPNIRINGNVSLVSDNSISLTNAGHSLGAVSLETTGVNGVNGTANITYTEGGTANLNAVRVNSSGSTTVPNGSLTVVSTGGSISQTNVAAVVGPPAVAAVKGSIIVPTVGTGTPTVTFTSNAGSVDLSDPAGTNSIPVAITLTAAGNSSIVQSNNTLLGNVAVSGGTLSVNTSAVAAKTITQATGTTVKAFGNSSFTTKAGAITLSNTGNNFGGLTLATNVGVSGLGTSTINAGNQLATVALTAATGTGYGANLTNVPVTITGGGGSGAVVTANTDAAGAITSFNITNAGSGYTSAPTVSIQPTQGADIAVTEAGTLNLLSVNSGTGKFAAVSEKAGIIQTGSLGVSAGGASTLTATASGVTLFSTNNNFGASPILVTTVGNVSIQDSNAITILNGGSTIGGALTLKNNVSGGQGEIKDSPGTLTVSGNVVFDTTTTVGSKINIGSSTASLGAIRFLSGAVTIVENATLNLLAGSVASGDVSLTSSGNIVTSGNGGGTFQKKLDLNASGSITITNPIFVNGSSGVGLTFRALGAVDLSALSKAGNLNSIDPTNLGASSYKAPNP
jgi:filamentous hemagglutinin family protein